MSLLIGQPISADELEQVTSTWPPERFATLCNTMAWAASGRAFQTFPSFTSRINVKDGGVDAEWTVEILHGNGRIPTPILGPGWNVFQYKQRDVFARKRQPIISNLRSSLNGAIKEVAKNFGKIPDQYILFVNIHLTPNETASLKKSIRANDDENAQTHVEVIGAEELAALLNDHPHLRASFFTPMAFQTWEDAYSSHRSKKRFGSHVELVGRESEVDRLRALVDASHIQAIVVSGPHDMGKSRLALEATKHKPYDTAVALDPRSTSLTDYRNLCTNRSEIICIVEDPELDTLQTLIGEALSVSGLKLLITLPTAAEASDLSYGFDDRIGSLELSPLNDEAARKLLQATGQVFDYGIQDWILSQAGGVPGIILAAASIGSGLRQDHTVFSTAAGKEFERRIAQELGEAALQSARLFSVLTHVGTFGPHEAEIQTICKIFGDDRSAHQMLAHLPELEKTGLARRVGYFVEISLPLLANHLVEQLVLGRRNELFALFARLDEAGQIRFIKRLAQVKGPEAEQFWDELFAPDGPLGTVDRILKRTHLLRLVAGTVPQQVLHVLEARLLTSPIETRLTISGDSRRELMWALEQLLFRANTSKDALRLIWLLAEAENETWGNNATGVLQESFHPHHSQMPLPLDERVALIKERLSSTPTTETKLLAIKTIEGGLKSRASIRLRHSVGPSPLDTRPPLTWSNVFNYLRSLAEILVSLAEDQGKVSHVALDVLPKSIAELAFQGLTAESRQYFKLLTDWALAERKGLDVSHLSDSMGRVRDFCAEQMAKPNFPEARKTEYAEFISKLTEWQASLDRAGFSIRLKLWAGGGHYRVSDDWKQAEEQLSLLAKEAVQSPKILTSDLMHWLLTASAKEARIFFYALGQEDQTFHFRKALETLGKNALGSRAFAPYFAGWAKRDLEGAESRLDQLAELHTVSAASLLETTSWLDPTPRGLKRIKRVAPEDPEYTAAILGRWIDRLDLQEFKEILQIIAGTNFECASAAVKLLGSWMYHQKPFDDELSDIAWRCIDHGPSKRTTRSAEGWHFDKLAAKLTNANPGLGFEKFHQLLTAPAAGSLEWEPLDMDGGEQWWKALRTNDRPRLFHVLLEASCANDTTQEVLSWRLKDLLDQNQDADDLLKAVESESAHARIAARWLVGNKPNFWNLAFAFLKKFPHDPALQDALTSAAMDRGTMIEGPGSGFYEARKQEIQKWLVDPSTPTEARAWLRDAAEALGSEVTTHLVWEYDREVNDLKRYIHGDDVDQKRWAIGRILKYAQWSDVRKLLTVKEIEEALPYLTLPEPRRTMIERLLPTWKHAG
ncbi:MAG: ATP-binding protein [Nitrospira defluvii]|nr:ATP-binding protein [Nitrospira defluvii]